MKAWVAILLAFSVCFNEVHFASSHRQSKMSSGWKEMSRKSARQVPAPSPSATVTGTAPVGSAPSNSPITKPTAADCTQAGFFPTPGSCVHFYRCVDWFADASFFSIFYFTCPVGSVFDDNLDVCNHAYAAGRPECGGAPSDPSGPVVTSGPVTPVVTSVPVVTSGPVTPIVTSVPVVTAGPVTPIVTSVPVVTSGPITPVVTPVSPIVTSGPIETEVATQPEISPGAFSLTCYTDNKYRVHPIYCNMYYICITEGVYSIPTLTCPHGLIFDEANQICAREVPGVDPNCERAPYSEAIPAETTPVMIATESPSSNETTTGMEVTSADTIQTETPIMTEEPATETETSTQDLVTVTDAPIGMTTQSTWTVHPDSLHECPAPGYYPYEEDCIRFYKCVETETSQLLGLLYRCPTGYGYSEERERCAELAELPPCEQTSTAPAFVRAESATVLYPEDLLWFFND